MLGVEKEIIKTVQMSKTKRAFLINYGTATYFVERHEGLPIFPCFDKTLIALSKRSK